MNSMGGRPLMPVTPDPEPATVLPGLAAALDGSGPALLLVPDGADAGTVRAALRPEDGVDPDTAVVVATSGSSGRPKGVRLSGSALRWSAAAGLERIGGPGRWLLAVPPTRIGGLQVLLRSLLAGTAPEVLHGFDVERFAAAAARLGHGHRRYTALVPTQLVRLLDAGVRLDDFDAVLVGGAATPPGLLGRARAAGVRVVRTYGMSETCGGCVYDGRALPGVELDVRADGRIRVAGPMLALGYRHGSPSGGSTGAGAGGTGAGGEGFHGGAFVTSDLGRLDADGVLHVLGRADDVIVTGGVNVVPRAVEEALGAHPDVEEAVVVGRADPDWGQAVVAVVVPVPGAEPELGELRRHVDARLSAPCAPRDLLVVAALPMLASGKLDRAAVRDLVGERAQSWQSDRCEGRWEG